MKIEDLSNYKLTQSQQEEKKRLEEFETYESVREAKEFEGLELDTN